jgi:hypothetical protein
LILPHNIDLMHQEQNVAKSIISMCLDVTSFTKDNMNARKDLASLCDPPSLEAKPNARGKLWRPKALYCLKLIERKEVDGLFIDQYAANINQMQVAHVEQEVEVEVYVDVEARVV